MLVLTVPYSCIDRNAYNMVLHKYGDRLYGGLTQTLERHLQEVVQSIQSAQGSDFLVQLNKQWQDHVKSMQMIRDILMYMDRTYIVQQNKIPVHELGLKLWKVHVVRNPTVQDRLLSTLLLSIESERKGEMIDRNLVRSSTKMLIDLGLPVYQEEFERHFLSSSSKFYKQESQELVSISSCPEYLKHAQRRLNEEVERVQNYLDATTEAKILQVVDQEMVGAHLKTLLDMENTGLVPLLREDQNDDLARLYMLSKRVDNGINILKEAFSAHLVELGKSIVCDAEKSQEAVAFVESLLSMKEKYSAIVHQPFSNDRTLSYALSEAFEHFMNLNTRAPEFISTYLDQNLRKAKKGAEEEDVEQTLDKVMSLFRYLEEKDVFERYYKQHLAKRLLSGKSASEDAERSIILKLKTECGYQFTSKLEGMFNDMKTSADTMERFKQHSAETSGNAGVDINVHVLTSGAWPSQPSTTCRIPAELEDCCETFRNFYLSTHTGRKLTWQMNLGMADLKVHFGDRKHELHVSTYQMCILLLFNDAEGPLTYEDIRQATGIPELDLQRSLQSLSLVKGRNVLTKDPMSKDICSTDQFCINESFHSKLYRVKIGTVTGQKEHDPERAETRRKIEEDRKPQIEAAIVRIMKSRRTLDHNNLVSEVTSQLSSRFMPTPPAIKKVRPPPLGPASPTPPEIERD